MNKYLLDTNIVSYFADNLSPHHETIVGKISGLDDNADVCISILSLYELSYGQVSADAMTAEMFNQTKNLMMEYFEIVNLSEESADIFGILKADFINQTGINKNIAKRHDTDLIIASSSIAENAVLISNDRIFETIGDIYAGFKYENWVVLQDSE